MDRTGHHRAVQLHADLERLLRAKRVFVTGMSLSIYSELLQTACDQHPSEGVLQEAALRAGEALGADESDPLAPRVEVQEALVVVGQLIALPLTN